MASDTDPSTIAAYGFAIASTLEENGVSPESVFEKCGVRFPNTTDPMLRISNNELNKLFRESARATENPSFGLLVGQHLRPANLHALGYALMASTSLRDFAERICSFHKFASQSVNISIRETADEFLLVSNVNTGTAINWETQDAYISIIIEFIRFIDSPSFVPCRVELIRPKPDSDVQAYHDYFQCPVLFDSTGIAISIDPKRLDKTLQGASKDLAQLHDMTVMHYLSRIEKQDIVNRVRTIVAKDLPCTSITREEVADKLCMSSRNMQVKLTSKGTSYQAILDSTRQSLALVYLEQSVVTITEAAYLTGFSDVSNFNRAFKRWTGKSPTDFRVSLGVSQ